MVVVVVDYFHYYLLIVEEKMDHDHCRDLVINEENFVENNLIEIEDLKVQHDKQFVDSKEIKNRFMKKVKFYLLMEHQVMGNFVDGGMIV
jgi:hypothetical protein